MLLHFFVKCDIQNLHNVAEEWLLKGTIKGDATTYTYNLHVSSTSSNSKNDCLELAILKITGKISLVIYKSVISKKTEHYTFDISPWRAQRFRCPCAYILYSKGHMYYYYVAANKEALQQDLMQIPKIAVCVSSYTFSLVLLLSFFIFLKVKTTFCGITLKKLKCISKWTQCMMIERMDR